MFDTHASLAVFNEKNKQDMKATVIVEKGSDGLYSAYMEEIFPDFGLAGYGDTAQEAIDDFYVCCEETAEYLKTKGKEMPDLSYTFKYNDAQ